MEISREALLLQTDIKTDSAQRWLSLKQGMGNRGTGNGERATGNGESLK